MTDILLIIMFNEFGDYELFGLILFFIGLILRLKPIHDDREIYLSYKISSFEGKVIDAAMAIIYFKFPDIYWIYALLYISIISGGLIGLFVFNYN